MWEAQKTQIYIHNFSIANKEWLKNLLHNEPWASFYWEPTESLWPKLGVAFAFVNLLHFIFNCLQMSSWVCHLEFLWQQTVTCSRPGLSAMILICTVYLLLYQLSLFYYCLFCSLLWRAGQEKHDNSTKTNAKENDRRRG